MANIMVVGSYVVDLMSRTPHMPKPGETVLGGPFQMGPGGKGSNQAVAAARQGANVTMVTKVGHDLFGDHAMENFTEESIDTTYVTRHTEEATGTAIITVDDQGENTIVVALGACGKITSTDVQGAEQRLEASDMVLVQLETSMDAIRTTIQLARKHNKPVILNPAPFQQIDDDLLQDVAYITPNETEASLLTGIEVVDESSARKAAKQLIERGVHAVVITLGKQGCFVYDGSDDGTLVKGFPVQAVDTTGAGDAFNGGLATFIAEGMKLAKAVIRANAVAAISVTKTGTAIAMPTMADVEEFLRNTK
ncbi:ribokinase [Virgibacillus salexigens]|uniref:Ribokinase n=1 Tax=Virgibacillus massiliensis TaxID=1462526 RepID=A0A024Q8Z6_9BACI|nr:ribokinase [Virgibacillus massiliensis]CDQ38700.1 Ribokinase [Virgibacillus massiliensis]